MISKMPSLNKLMYDVEGRTKEFFGISPVRINTPQGIAPYQMGAYLAPWGEIYGTRQDRGLAVTGRGTGKSSIWQDLNGADLLSFLPYFLQAIHHERKPIPIDLILVANVKKNAKKRLESIKAHIRANEFLESNIVDYQAWTKDAIALKNNAHAYAEGSSDNARGYHRRHKHGKVIYFLEEMAFWGGAQCMDSKDFIENIADQSMGAGIWGFTTPYGKRGGTWHFWNHPLWLKWQAPSWANPHQDRRVLARRKAYLKKMGRDIIIDQEMKGLFVDDAGLFFSNETWMKGVNPNLEWMFEGNFAKILDAALRLKSHPGEFLLGIDPNKGIKTKSGDPVGINLTEKIGNTYVNRMTVALNGIDEYQLMDFFKVIFSKLKISKILFDSGGGYWKGLWTMFKGLTPPMRNLYLIDPQGNGVVEYMTNLRTAMLMGLYQMPDSEELRNSQQAMKGFGDTEADSSEGDVSGKIIFQTEGKKSGIPCDLCAMGLSLSRERFARDKISPGKAEELIKAPVAVEAITVGENFAVLGGDFDRLLTQNLTSAGMN